MIDPGASMVAGIVVCGDRRTRAEIVTSRRGTVAAWRLRVSRRCVTDKARSPLRWAVREHKVCQHKEGGARSSTPQ